MQMFSGYDLHITEENFFIHPISTSRPINDVLVIDRLLNDLSIRSENSIPPISTKKTIYGLVGAIKLIAGYNLIVITSKSKVGNIDDHEIWKVNGFEMIPYYRNENHLSENERRLNYKYKSLVENFLLTQHFYFSYTYDLTRSLQKMYELSSEFQAMPLFERTDRRFMWNNYLIKNLNPTKELSNFVVPIVLGFMSINPVDILGRKFDFILISRRSCFNAGTRYNVRGADKEGEVANFIETEQIVNFGEFKYSYVIVRGSIPIQWTQKPNLKYKPPMIIENTSNNFEICRKHFSKLVAQYNQNVCVNLTNQHGSEGQLEKTFSEMVRLLNDPLVKFESFDFHKQCGNDKWDRLSILINRLANDQDSFGYFSVTKNGSILSAQRGVFRINCIDCLDRTNVVQGLLAKRMLHIQLIKLNILVENEAIEYHEGLYNIFRNVWADNGDFCSVQYAGTGALKSDFTRLGKRTTYGLLRDGVNSLQRYFLNNFYDGFRQDSIDFFLGNYTVLPNEGAEIEKSPLSSTEDKKYMALPVIGLGTFSMFIISFLIPAENLQEQFTYVLFWGFATLCTLAIMVYYGKEIVDTPKLVHRKDKKE